MRFRIPTFCITIVAVLAHATVGAAQTIPSPFQFIERNQELGLLGGYRSADTGRFGLAPSGGTLTGIRYGVELSGPLSLEAMAAVMSGTRDIINPGRLEGEQLVGVADVRLANVDARVRFSFVGDRTWHRLNPFLTFGGGIAFDAAGTPPEEDDLEPADIFDFGTSFIGTVGAGTRWFVTNRFALRGDGVFSLWGANTPPGYADPEREFENVEEKEWLAGLSFSVTLLYRF